MPDGLKLKTAIPDAPSLPKLVVRPLDATTRGPADDRARAARAEKKQQIDKLRRQAASLRAPASALQIEGHGLGHVVDYTRSKLVTPAMQLLIDARKAIAERCFADAVKLLDRLLREHRDDRDALQAMYLRATCFDALDRPEEALAALQPLFAPGVPRGLAIAAGKLREQLRQRVSDAVLGTIEQLQDGKRFDEALELARRLVELDPDASLYRLVVAQVHGERGEAREALRAIDDGRNRVSIDDLDALDEARPGYLEAAARAAMAPVRERFLAQRYPEAAAALRELSPDLRAVPLCSALCALAEARAKGDRAADVPERTVSADELYAFVAEPAGLRALAEQATKGKKPALGPVQAVLAVFPRYRYARFVYAMALYHAVVTDENVTLESARAQFSEALEHARAAASDKSITHAADLVEVLAENLRMIAELEILVPVIQEFSDGLDRYKSVPDSEAVFARLEADMTRVVNSADAALARVELPVSKLVLTEVGKHARQGIEQIPELRRGHEECEEIHELVKELEMVIQAAKRSGDRQRAGQALFSLLSKANDKRRSFRSESGRQAAAQLAEMLEQLLNPLRK